MTYVVLLSGGLYDGGQLFFADKIGGYLRINGIEYHQIGDTVVYECSPSSVG